MCWTNQTTLYLAIVKDTNAKKEKKKKKVKFGRLTKELYQIVPKSFKSFRHILGQYSVLFESLRYSALK